MSGVALSLAETAARVGVSADRLRKVWKAWSRERQFPAPFNGPPDANYAWEAYEVDAWVASRSQALGLRHVAPLGAEGGPPPPARGSREAQRLRRDREELAQLMRRAS